MFKKFLITSFQADIFRIFAGLYEGENGVKVMKVLNLLEAFYRSLIVRRDEEELTKIFLYLNTMLHQLHSSWFDDLMKYLKRSDAFAHFMEFFSKYDDDMKSVLDELPVFDEEDMLPLATM